MHKMNFGNVMIHPTKCWPWIGTLEYNHQYHTQRDSVWPSSTSNKACEKCKKPLKPESKAIQTQSATSKDEPSASDASTSKTPVESLTYCSCAAKTPKTTVAITAQPGGPVQVSIAAGFAAFGNLEAKIQSFENKLVDMGLVPNFWSDQGSSYRTRTSKQWRINWYPTGDYGELDDTELQLSSTNGVTAYPVGSTVRGRKADGNDMCGFVQSCNFTADVFLFPSYRWVLKDVPSDRLKPAKLYADMKTMVIYKGCWLANVNQKFYSVTLRLKDFDCRCVISKRDVWNLRNVDEKSRNPNVTFLFEGQELVGSISLLSKAEWPDGKPTGEMFDRIPLVDSADTASGKKSRKAVYSSGGVLVKMRQTAICSGRGGRRFRDSRESDGSVVKEEQIQFVVEKVELCSLTCDWKIWLCSEHKKWHSLKDPCTNKPPFSKPSQLVESSSFGSLEMFTIPSSSNSSRMNDSRFKYLCTVDDTKDLCTREEWRSEFVASKSSAAVAGVEAPQLLNSPTEDRPAVGKEVLVEILWKKEFYEVVWEDGTTQEKVGPADLISAHSYTDAGGNLVSIPGNFGNLPATFHPGMYVTTAGRQEVSPTPDSSTSLSTAASKTSLLPQGLIAALKKSQMNEESNLNRLKSFGIVTKCSSKEKFATVKWYKQCHKGSEIRIPPDLFAEPESPESHQFYLDGEEDMSFYDLKPMGFMTHRVGEMVTRSSSEGDKSAVQIGCVRKTDVNGLCHVSWYEGCENGTAAAATESTGEPLKEGVMGPPVPVSPLDLRRLTGFFSGVPNILSELVGVEGFDPLGNNNGDDDGSVGSDTPAGNGFSDLETDEDEEFLWGPGGGYFHPPAGFDSDEDVNAHGDLGIGLQDLNWNALSPQKREKRIAFAICFLKPILSQLISLLVAVHNGHRHLERKRFVRLVVQISDIISSFAFCKELRSARDEFFKANGMSGPNVAAATLSAAGKRKALHDTVKETAKKFASSEQLAGPSSLSMATMLKDIEAKLFDVTKSLELATGGDPSKVTSLVNAELSEDIDENNVDMPYHDILKQASSGLTFNAFHTGSGFHINYAFMRSGPRYLYIQSARDRLLDWVSGMSMLDYYLRKNQKAQQKKANKKTYGLKMGFPVKTRMIDELDTPSNSSSELSSPAGTAMEVESLNGQGVANSVDDSNLLPLSAVFSTFDGVKCGLVAISLSLRSGSATSSDTLNLTLLADNHGSSVVSVPTCKEFLGLLKLPDPKKKSEQSFLKKLPCFALKKKKEVIKGLANNPKWKSEKWRADKPASSEATQMPSTSAATANVSETESNGPVLTAEEIVRKALELGDSLMKPDAAPLDFVNDDIMSVCNLVADGVCLSLLSLLYDLLEAAGTVIPPDPMALSKDVETTDLNTDSLDGFASQSSDKDVADGVKSAGSAMEQTDSPQVGPAEVHSRAFEMVESVNSDHHYLSKPFNSANVPKTFIKAVQKELRLLQTSLPRGIFVKAFESRMDLLSCMIIGPLGTPYADSIFIFDVHLREEHPLRPPHVFYHSLSKRINPNLYEDGKVCLSLLGTWNGKETELWTSESNLLQVFVSIQSLILVNDPYFNEPGYERSRGTPEGDQKSREYNEMTVLRSLECLSKIFSHPPQLFAHEIAAHMRDAAPRICRQLEAYESGDVPKDFGLAPVTKGFTLCIKRYSQALKNVFVKEHINVAEVST